MVSPGDRASAVATLPWPRRHPQDSYGAPRCAHSNSYALHNDIRRHRAAKRPRLHRCSSMLDLIFLASGILFLVMLAAYADACDRL